MTIRDILKISAVYLGREDLIAYFNDSTAGNVSLAEVDSFVKCANFVINELATEYVPIKTTEGCDSTNGQILYSSLSATPLDILNVYDAFGNSLEFKTTPLYVKTSPSAVRIEYSYVPVEYSLNDTVAYTENTLPARVIAYGVTAETCLIDGKYREAEIWDKRFKDSILNVIIPKRSVMKGRCWM
ncbi:MAG: hypothetical protein MJ072_06510 [Clostridia bacterium]|nr:hypothetical protein [Clostridia bacterium]